MAWSTRRRWGTKALLPERPRVARGNGSNYTLINISSYLPMELKTARLTVLIDPAKKDAFEQLCRKQDLTPSQVVRRLIRDFMEQAAPADRAPKRAPARKSGR